MKLSFCLNERIKSLKYLFCLSPNDLFMLRQASSTKVRINELYRIVDKLCPTLYNFKVGFLYTKSNAMCFK